MINALVGAWAALVGERRRAERCRMLLVDEASIRKRHRYVTVTLNADTGRTLAMIPHRSTAALSVFGARQGHTWCKGVKVVVSDGPKAYKAAIDTRLGHARHVLDRFHVIRWFAAGLTAVRRDIQRRTPPGITPAFDPDVFRARFVLGRRPAHGFTNYANFEAHGELHRWLQVNGHDDRCQHMQPTDGGVQYGSEAEFG